MLEGTTRLDELLIRRATEGLVGADKAELEALLQDASLSDPETFDRAAAAIHISRLATGVRLPGALRERIERQALRFLASNADKNPEDVDPR